MVLAKGTHVEHDGTLLMHMSASPLASVADSVSVTVGILVTLAPPLMATVPGGGAASTVTWRTVAWAVPPSLVARMLSRRTWPWVPTMPLASHVNAGMVPATMAVCHVAPPSIVYSQAVTGVPLSVKLVRRSKGLSTHWPERVLEA